jgi:predicted nucleotide-binding protein
MAKKVTPIIKPMDAKLIIRKSELVEKLQLRISKGEELFERKVNSQPELKVLQSDYSEWTDYNSELLKQSFTPPNNEYKSSYDDSGKFIGLYDSDHSAAKQLENLKERINSKVSNLKKLNTKSELLKSEISEEEVETVAVTKKEINKTEVFIVHGHDETAKTKTARFIQQLGFKPIILHEQASGSKTVIEKIEAYSNVGFGIILYTPCDVGSKKQEHLDLKNRARQNVVFEHGFLIGKIGRENVCALVKDEIETPNDISGVVYVKMDDDDAWHLKIAKELRNSGYEVDMNKI